MSFPLSPSPRALNALAAARAAGRSVGLDVRDAQLLRERSSIHVLLPHATVIARVEDPANLELANRQVAVSRVLTNHGAPVAQLVGSTNQPIHRRGLAVILWHCVESRGAVDPVALGDAVRRIHLAAQVETDSDLPAIEPLSRIRSSLSRAASWIGEPAWERLSEMTAALAPRWPRLVANDPIGTGLLVHGDVHLENAIQTRSGPILVDLEDAGIGPASWDFVPMWLGVRRYGLSRSIFDGFVAGYDSSPEGWRDFDGLVRVYELLVVAWTMECAGQSAEMAEESKIRVATLVDGTDHPWRQL